MWISRNSSPNRSCQSQLIKTPSACHSTTLRPQQLRYDAHASSWRSTMCRPSHMSNESRWVARWPWVCQHIQQEYTLQHDKHLRELSAFDTKLVWLPSRMEKAEHASNMSNKPRWRSTCINIYGWEEFRHRNNTGALAKHMYAQTRRHITCGCSCKMLGESWEHGCGA